jgi:hypothetical protein
VGRGRGRGRGKEKGRLERRRGLGCMTEPMKANSYAYLVKGSNDVILA